MKRQSKSSGFTLIELLVVIAVIGVLIGLLLPAVQAVREAGRRTQCLNHLKQMSLATVDFEDVNHKYPPGYTFPAMAMWSAYILPFIEQNNLYATIDLNGPWAYVDTNNSRACASYVSVFQCPSASVAEHVANAQGIDGRVPCTYLGCGSGLIDSESGPSPYVGDSLVGDGIFLCNTQLKHRDIVDGTSTTVLIGESLFDFGLFGPDNVGDIEVVDHWYIGSAELLPNSPDNSLDMSEAIGSTACPINAFLQASSPINHKELGFSSRHPGGCQVSFADGHAQFISASIDPKVWSAIGTRKNNESVGSLD